MSERGQVYKCNPCGHIVEVIKAGPGTLTCCDQPMKLLNENTTDAAVEKHVPVVEKTAEGWVVTVGSVDHPMTEDHLIDWIELVTEDNVYRTYLCPNDPPKATFQVNAENVTARAYCNLHGLWKA